MIWETAALLEFVYNMASFVVFTRADNLFILQQNSSQYTAYLYICILYS